MGGRGSGGLEGSMAWQDNDVFLMGERFLNLTCVLRCALLLVPPFCNRHGSEIDAERKTPFFERGIPKMCLLSLSLHSLLPAVVSLECTLWEGFFWRMPKQAYTVPCRAPHPRGQGAQVLCT